jgi:hypothetical protein
MQTAPLITNHVTIDVLQRLLFSEDKPSRLTPVDLAVISYLILRRTHDHEILDSAQTIAARLSGDRRVIGRSLERLRSLGWVSVGSRGNGRTKAISINIDMLPAAQPVRAKITQDAKKLTWRYMTALGKMGRKKFPKNWHTRQFPSAQRILTLCSADLELAARVLGHGLNNPKFKKRTAMSLYHALIVWHQIADSYQKQSKAQIIPTTQEVEPSNGQ